jgi:hypothetical protein
MTSGAENTQLKSWNGKDTVPCRLLVVNNSNVVVDVLWVTPTGAETSYRVLQPGQLHRQGESCDTACTAEDIRRPSSKTCAAPHVSLNFITLMQRLSAPMSGGYERCSASASWLSTLAWTPRSSCRKMATPSWCMMGMVAALVVLCQQPATGSLEALFALMPQSPTYRYRQDIQPKRHSKHPKEWGSYRQRAVSAIGIPIMVTTSPPKSSALPASTATSLRNISRAPAATCKARLCHPCRHGTV